MFRLTGRSLLWRDVFFLSSLPWFSPFFFFLLQLFEVLCPSVYVGHRERKQQFAVCVACLPLCATFASVNKSTMKGNDSYSKPQRLELAMEKKKRLKKQDTLNIIV